MTEPELESGAVLFPCGLNPCTAPANRRQPTHLGMGGREWKALTHDRAGEGRLDFSLKQSVFSITCRSLSDSRSHVPQGGYISWSTLRLTVSAVGGTSDPTHGCSSGDSARSGEKTGDAKRASPTWPHSAGGSWYQAGGCERAEI